MNTTLNKIFQEAVRTELYSIEEIFEMGAEFTVLESINKIVNRVFVNRHQPREGLYKELIALTNKHIQESR